MARKGTGPSSQTRRAIHRQPQFASGDQVPAHENKIPHEPRTFAAVGTPRPGLFHGESAAMKALLLCPAARPALKVLAEQAPLASLPVLGKSLIQYWLAHLASLGAKQVRVVVTDRPAQVCAQVGDGARWGLRVEVFSEAWELTADEARSKYTQGDAGWATQNQNAPSPRPSPIG